MPLRLPRQTAVEWAFVVCLTTGCAVLTALQYHWTGEVSRATAERLRSDFQGQTQLLGHAFDTELIDACNRLLPADDQGLTAATREAVHVARWQRWLAGKPRPIFRRLAVAVPERAGLGLYLLEPSPPRLSRAAWPAEWNTLRDNLARKAAAGSGPPFQDSTGALIEFPVFREHLENEWMIFELDLDYAGKHWLPDLVTQYLDPDRRSLGEATVHPFLHPETVLFTTGRHMTDPGARTASVRFNGQGWGTDSPSRRGEEDFWVLDARQSPAALEALVSRARWRNLALASLLNALVLLAGLALLRYAQRARRMSALHGRFVANASHELRTPLTVIRGAGQNLARGVATDPARVAQYGQFIVQHADTLQRLVERTLELADVRRLSATPNHAPLAIQDVLEGAIAATLADTRAAGCKVEAQIPSGLPPVCGDAAALRRVFQNLLTNAAKYAASGGWIGVKAEQVGRGTGSVVEVRVEDRGPGIPAAEQAHLFEPFARGAASREQQIAGSGLGLSMVQEIVQAHGGTVTLESTPGVGSTFIVRLPALAKN